MARNFLWITTDHQLYYPHLALNGDQYRLKNFARICEAGSCYPNTYCPMPLCAPSRSSMITGIYPHRHGIILNTFGKGMPAELPQTLPFFHRPMQQAGYRTAWFGKWHCGKSSTAADYGFEGFSMPGYGDCYNSAEYMAYAAEKGLGNPRVTIEWSAKLLPIVGQTIECGGGRVNPYWGGWAPPETTGHMLTPKEGHEAYFLTDMACRWLDGLGKDEPFMLKLELWGPHHPYHVAAPFYGSVDPEKIKLSPSFLQELGADMPDTYRSSVRRWFALQHSRLTEAQWRQIIARAYEHAMMVDDAYGRILDYLEQNGLMENTTVIFTSDHGDILGTHSGLFNKDSIMTEETVRVPLAIAGAGIPKGMRDERISTNMDIVPTIFELAGLPAPESWDGMSLLGDARRERLVVEEHGEIRIDQYQRLLVEGSCRYIAHLNEVDEFYDLAEDPYQSRNLLFDAGHAASLRRCRADLLAELDAIGDCSEHAQQLRSQITHKMQTGDEYAYIDARNRFDWM